MPKARHRLRTALYHRVSTREQNPRLARSELRGLAVAAWTHALYDVWIMVFREP